MKLIMNKLIKLLTLLLLPTITFAQSIEMADAFRSSGKIYVVVAVIVAIFLGIVAFLLYLDKKITKLENQIKEDDV